ncbi:MAG: hypothetical protein GYA23_10355, partial [Methanomicrobiales archaeon]|nr:hypothetical protein [Methanomicrobiales archaeon]
MPDNNTMNRIIIACIIIAFAGYAAPASAFIDRNHVITTAQFGDYVPA